MKKINRKSNRIARVNANQIIRPLVKTNPLKPGTFCFAQLNAALKSHTVEEAQRKLKTDKKNPTPKRKLETAWLRHKGFIALKTA